MASIDSSELLKGFHLKYHVASRNATVLLRNSNIYYLYLWRYLRTLTTLREIKHERRVGNSKHSEIDVWLVA